MVQTNARTRKLVKRKRVKKSDITREMLEKYLRELSYSEVREKTTYKLYMSKAGMGLFDKVMQQEVEKHNVTLSRSLNTRDIPF